MDLKITSNPYKSKRGNQDIEKIKRLNQSMLMMNTNQLTETSAPPGCETFSWSTQKEDPCEKSLKSNNKKMSDRPEYLISYTQGVRL